MDKLKTILVAVDFSENSDKAFATALFMSRTFEARLLLLHVINEPVDMRGFYVPHISFDRLEEEIAEGAAKLMEQFCKNNLQGIENYETLIVAGVPYQEIIHVASQKNVDLIVMGTHGRTGLDHVLFGSTAEKVVRKSPLPVLTVRLADN
jgi:nucleotide-binding universal stress UspA family protein